MSEDKNGFGVEEPEETPESIHDASQSLDSESPSASDESSSKADTNSEAGKAEAGKAEADALNEELADLVDDLGPQSKEAELLADLQRLQAEFVNYKNRVERDRDVSRNSAIAEVLRSLLPVLDDLGRAEAHGDLEGSPFAAVATKLRNAGEKFGLKQFGEKGDKFDPELHNALVQTPSASVTDTRIADVVEYGFQVGDRLLRPAMVAVFIPAEDNAPEAE
jgi:molecular chaperone GrpE